VGKRTHDFAFVCLCYRRSGEEICTGYAMAASGRMQYDYTQTNKLPAKDMIHDIGEESDDDGEKRRPSPRSVPTMKTGFGMFDRQLPRRILRQQRDYEVI